MQHQHGSGDSLQTGPALAIAEQARDTRAGVRTAGAYALALALMVITITGLLAAVIFAR